MGKVFSANCILILLAFFMVEGAQIGLEQHKLWMQLVLQVNTAYVCGEEKVPGNTVAALNKD